MSATEYSTDCVRPVMLTSNTTYQSPRLSATTHAQITDEFEHSKIHDGDHYFYFDYDNDVDTASPKYYRLTTPNTTTWINISSLVIYSEGVGTWQLFENPTINASGTTATTFNSDRNSSKTSSLVIAYDPTSTADGTQIKVWRTGSGTTTPSRVGSDAGRGSEIILKQNEDYFLKFTPDADNSKTKLEIEWYEHINRTA